MVPCGAVVQRRGCIVSNFAWRGLRRYDPGDTSRDAEKIAEYLATKGATKCPPATVYGPIYPHASHFTWSGSPAVTRGGFHDK